MCQYGNYPVEGSVTGYRVYEKRHSQRYISNISKVETITELFSYYSHCAISPLGVVVQADSYEPFHAFQSLEDVAAWFISEYHRPAIAIFKCELSDDVKSGTWEDTVIKTYTGFQCKLIQEVPFEEAIPLCPVCQLDHNSAPR